MYVVHRRNFDLSITYLQNALQQIPCKFSYYLSEGAAAGRSPCHG